MRNSSESMHPAPNDAYLVNKPCDLVLLFWGDIYSIFTVFSLLKSKVACVVESVYDFNSSIIKKITA